MVWLKWIQPQIGITGSDAFANLTLQKTITEHHLTNHSFFQVFFLQLTKNQVSKPHHEIDHYIRSSFTCVSCTYVIALTMRIVKSCELACSPQSLLGALFTITGPHVLVLLREKSKIRESYTICERDFFSLLSICLSWCFLLNARRSLIGPRAPRSPPLT